MSIFNDAWDAAGDLADSITGELDSILHDIPGSEWVKDFANGPLKDFANSKLGMVVLRAQAGMLAQYSLFNLGTLIGPALAHLSFALPGVLRGENLRNAWLNESSWRLAKLAEYFGGEAAKQATEQLTEVRDILVERAKTAFPGIPMDEALRKLDITPEAVAKEFGIKDDYLAALLVATLKERALPHRAMYDERMGKRRNVPLREALKIVGLDGAPSLRAVTGGGSVVAWYKSL